MASCWARWPATVELLLCELREVSARTTCRPAHDTAPVSVSASASPHRASVPVEGRERACCRRAAGRDVRAAPVELLVELPSVDRLVRRGRRQNHLSPAKARLAPGQLVQRPVRLYAAPCTLARPHASRPAPRLPASLPDARQPRRHQPARRSRRPQASPPALKKRAPFSSRPAARCSSDLPPAPLPPRCPRP